MKIRKNRSNCFWHSLGIAFLLSSGLLSAQQAAEPASKQGNNSPASGPENPESPKDSENQTVGLFYWKVGGSYINDYETGGAVMNTDDRYTFGLDLQGALNNWDLLVDYRSFTDRYRNPSRFEELRFSGQYLWGNFLDPAFWQSSPHQLNRRRSAAAGRTATLYLGLGPQISYLGAGNLVGEELQNSIHRTIHVTEVFLPYIFPQFHGLELGSDLYFSWLWPFGRGTQHLEDSSLELGLFLNERLALGLYSTGNLGAYSQNFELGALLRLASNSHFVEIKPSFKQLSYLDEYQRDNSVAQLWAETQTAFWLDVAYRAGLLQRSWAINFGSLENPSNGLQYGYGWARWTISLAALPRKKSFAEADFATSFLFSPISQMNQDKLSYQKALGDKLLLGFNISMLRSLKRHDKLQYDGDVMARINNGLYLFSVGLKPLFALGKFGYLELYAEVGLGIYNLLNSDKFSNILRQQGRQYFALGAQIGTRWYGLPLRKDGAVYGIETALLAYAPFISENDMQSLKGQGFPADSYQPQLAWMIGFCVITDL